VEYGKALLRKAQAADDPFGSKVPKETPVGVNPAAAAGGAGGEGGGAGGAGGEGGGEGGGKGGGEGDDGGDGGEGDADYEEGEEGGEGDEEEADDLELAFQCLEMARLALEQAPGRARRTGVGWGGALISAGARALAHCRSSISPRCWSTSERCRWRTRCGRMR